MKKRRCPSGGRRLVVAKLSQALGLDETVFGLPGRIHQSIRRQPAKALNRTTQSKTVPPAMVPLVSALAR
jgi:hypothetical protein